LHHSLKLADHDEDKMDVCITHVHKMKLVQITVYTCGLHIIML